MAGNKNILIQKHHKEIDNDFIHAIICKWKNLKQVFNYPSGTFEVSVKETTPKKA